MTHLYAEVWQNHLIRCKNAIRDHKNSNNWSYNKLFVVWVACLGMNYNNNVVYNKLHMSFCTPTTQGSDSNNQ